MPRRPPPHPVLTSRVAASVPGTDFRKLDINYLGAFNDRWDRYKLEDLSPHYLFMGATGSGKTTAMKLHMYSVFTPPDHRFSMRYRGLIYDPKSDLLSFLARMGFTSDDSVILTNPFDRRSACWDIASDITSDADAQAFAEILVQDNPGQEFWQTSTRDIVSSLVSGLNAEPHTRKNWDLRDLVLIAGQQHLLEQVLERTDQGRGALADYFKGDTRLSGNIRATLRANLAAYRLIAAVWDHAKYSFTFTQWARGAGIVLIGDHYKYRDPMRRVNNLLVRYAIDNVMDRPGIEEQDLSWFYLDELKNAGKFPNFGTMLTQGRSKGIRCVLAAQGLSTLQASFPEHEEKEVINNCGNKCIMQLGSDEDARWAERLFSTVTRVKESRTHPIDQPDRGTKTTHEEKEPRLEAKDFLELPSAMNTGGSIHAYYHAPQGFYHTRAVPGDEVTASMPPPLSSPVIDFLPRPQEQFTLRPFAGTDYEHLKLDPNKRSRTKDAGEDSKPFKIPERFQ